MLELVVDDDVDAANRRLLVLARASLAPSLGRLALLRARLLSGGEGERVAVLELLQRPLDLRDEEGVAIGVKRSRSPSHTGATGAPHAVHVILEHAGQVEVDDVLHALDVESARGDVGGDENRAPPGGKVGQRGFSLLLRPASVKRRRRHPLRVEQGHDLVRPRLALDEDHRHRQRAAELFRLRLLLEEQFAQPVHLLRVHQLLEVLRDV